MQPYEIQVGITYRCRSGWLRQPTKIRPDGMVNYLSWRESKPDDEPYRSSGHINWFSNAALAPLSNGDVDAEAR